MSMLKKTTLFLGITLIVIPCFIVMVIKYEAKTSIDRPISSLLIRAFHKFLPELFVGGDVRMVRGSFSRMIEVWAYVDKHSITPGEQFNLMLSSVNPNEVVSGHIEIFRIGYYPKSDRKLVWKSDRLEVSHQRVLHSAASIGAAWIPTISKIPTRGWQSGYYTIDFVKGRGVRNSNLAYLVVTNPGFSGDILVKISTNTYQAYNTWGGHSFYKSAFHGGHKGQVVSFDRPTESRFFEYEYYFVIWLEKLAQEYGLTVDYATNFDVHSDDAYVEAYKLFIHVGHDEYWSKEEFDRIYRRIFVLGKNTIFLGANIAFWQVRYADVNGFNGSKPLGRQLISYKTEDDPIRYRISGNADLFFTQKFRDRGRRPETMLMGVAFCVGCNFYHQRGKFHYPYYVKNTVFPFFKGTGYAEKEFVGNVIGYEWDNTDPEEDGKRLWDPNRSLIPEIPQADIHVVFSGTGVNYKGQKKKAEAVYFESRARAKVFSAGTIGWSWGLGKEGHEEEKFKRFNRNLVLYFLE